MKELIVRLAEACGPAGNEDNVRALLKEAVEKYADEVREDVVGNLIATKKGTGANKQHLALVAHMDESGLMVLHVEESGLLRVGGIGPVEPAYLVGQRVQFPNGTIGVVGSESAEDVTMLRLFVDLGVTSKAEALERVKVGDSCALLQNALEIAPNRLVGKALDNRVGCAAAVEVLKRLGTVQHDVSVIFSVQHGVGSRGVKTAGFALKPDFALVLDGVRTGDVPGAGRIEVKLGGGPSVKIMDNGVIVPPRIKHFLIERAEAAGIPYQLEVNAEGTSDTGTLLLIEDGIPSGALSVPVRCLASGAEIVDLRDVEATVNLAVSALQSYSL
jgi:putative aminopeptidase FrvX